MLHKTALSKCCLHPIPWQYYYYYSYPTLHGLKCIPAPPLVPRSRHGPFFFHLFLLMTFLASASIHPVSHANSRSLHKLRSGVQYHCGCRMGYIKFFELNRCAREQTVVKCGVTLPRRVLCYTIVAGVGEMRRWLLKESSR